MIFASTGFPNFCSSNFKFLYVPLSITLSTIKAACLSQSNVAKSTSQKRCGDNCDTIEGSKFIVDGWCLKVES